MTLTTPKTDWVDGELVTADDMNEIGELLKKLMAPPPTASYTTPSDIAGRPSSWTDIDSNNLNFTLNTAAGMYWRISKAQFTAAILGVRPLALILKSMESCKEAIRALFLLALPQINYVCP